MNKLQQIPHEVLIGIKLEEEILFCCRNKQCITIFAEPQYKIIKFQNT